jgi:hypothetical protein
MITWRPMLPENFFLFSPIGLLLVDDWTGRAPLGRVDAILDVQDGPAWRTIERDPVITASGVLTYPGLGRTTDVTQPAQHYRIRLDAPMYRPLYRATTDGIEFDVPPFDDANPPASVTTRPTHTVLLPAPHYPFAPYVAVLRGIVEDPGGAPVADVLVQESLRERALTDERGAFSLSLRWVSPGAATTITANDQRNGRTGSITITLPADLNLSQTITVS